LNWMEGEKPRTLALACGFFRAVCAKHSNLKQTRLHVLGFMHQISIQIHERRFQWSAIQACLNSHFLLSCLRGVMNSNGWQAGQSNGLALPVECQSHKANIILHFRMPFWLSSRAICEWCVSRWLEPIWFREWWGVDFPRANLCEICFSDGEKNMTAVGTPRMISCLQKCLVSSSQKGHKRSEQP
jgi:hypothetical protein